LHVQRKREGKASAINLFLSTSNADIYVLISGDTIPERQTIDKLVTPFIDPTVGMTGGRPVPVNSDRNFTGFAVQLLWKLHHRISLERPKMGELVAFRGIKRIPGETAVDEASIEAMITSAGLRLKYVGEAIVYNKGPENIGEFLIQRRRITAGHLHLRATQRYSVSTASLKNILKALMQEMHWGFRSIAWTGGTIILEGIGRALGRYDYSVRKSNPYVWDVVTSTKKIAGERK
jgi:cellulose synthase/poly-beta-1,6-N-acetylglucosamine synthase-like glycosyltransferase